MAETAPQSTHISSSRGGEPGGCTAGPCADFFVSTSKASSSSGSGSESTQKADVFQAPAVDSGPEATPKSPDATDLLFTTSCDPPSYSPLAPSGFTECAQPKWEDAFSSKGGWESQMHEQEEKHDMMAAPVAGLKVLMLGEEAPAKKEHEPLQRSSHTKVPGETTPEVESPSSPFEVLVERTQFKEFSDGCSGNSGQAGKFVETEWLTKSWSSGAVTTGDFPTGPPSYESVTQQDLDSREFQGLSRDLMSNWDMTPKAFQVSTEPFDKFKDPSPDFQRVGLYDLSPEICRPQGSLGFSPQKEPNVTKKDEPVVGSSLVVCGIQDAPVGVKAVDSDPHLVDSFELTADSNWSDAAETAEADSSGESDDTVIEDTKAGLALVGTKKEPEKIEPPKAAGEPPCVEKASSVPFSGALAPEREVDAEYSPEELAYHEKSKLPYAIPEEEDLEFMDDFETIQAPLTMPSFESELVPQKAPVVELSSLEIQKLEMSNKFISEFSSEPPSEILLKDDNLSAHGNEPFFLSFEKTTAPPEQQGSMRGEGFMDFMKEWSAENNQHFLDSLTQAKEASMCAGKADARAPSTHTDRAVMLKELPLTEMSQEAHTIYTRPGETAMTGSKYSSQGGNLSAVKLQPSPASPEAARFFLDLDQEQLTIKALRELSTIPDESPGSPEERSPSPKEKMPLLTYDKPEEAFVSACESVSQGGQIEAAEDEVEPILSFVSTNLPGASVVPNESLEAGASSSTVEQAKERGAARLPTECSVRDLVFWRDAKKSGVVFGTSLVMLLSLAAFSVISVVAYLILALLSVTISFRVYRCVIQAVQKSEEGHPFKSLLDADISVTSETFHNYMNTALVYVNKTLRKVRRLFLVEDLVDSLKLAVFMWLMTYVGAVFNGITLLILGLLLAFSVPVVYEKYQTQIDHYVSIIREQSKSVIEKVHAKLPGLAKKKAE